MEEYDIVDVHRELFNRSFMVYMPYSATVSREELYEYGVVGLHTKESLRKYLDDPILVNATLVQIAEAIGRGDQVSLSDTKDAAVMYDLVVQHLENWLKIGHTHLASRLPPLEDLIAFDELAGTLHPYVIVEDDPTVTSIDYALGDDLLLGMMDHGITTPQLKGYQPYQAQFIELGVV